MFNKVGIKNKKKWTASRQSRSSRFRAKPEWWRRHPMWSFHLWSLPELKDETTHCGWVEVFPVLSEQKAEERASPRVNYQTFVWRKALTAIQHLPQPESNGWVREDSSLKLVYMTKEPAPSSLLELTTCTCQSGCQSNCSCNNTGLSCSEACYCMASSDMCRNPHGVLLDFWFWFWGLWFRVRTIILVISTIVTNPNIAVS